MTEPTTAGGADVPGSGGVPRFRRDALIIDVLEAHPGAAAVLRGFGIPCETCVVAETESLAAGARLNRLDVDAILARLASLPPDPGGGGA